MENTTLAKAQEVHRIKYEFLLLLTLPVLVIFGNLFVLLAVLVSGREWKV